jgi:hypothetical protein
VLRRGQRDPMVWPFETEDDADDFKLEHGLLDWRSERMDNPEQDHEPVCAHDRERWPCRYVRLEQEARGIIRAAENRCHRCGKQIGWYKVTFKGAGELGQDVHYHGKLGPCFNEARRRAAETQDEGALRDVARAEESREFGRELRRRKAAA